jgi:hypothetical protein
MFNRLILPNQELVYPHRRRWRKHRGFGLAQRRCCCARCNCVGTLPSQVLVTLGGDTANGPGGGGSVCTNCTGYLADYVLDSLGYIDNSNTHPLWDLNLSGTSGCGSKSCVWRYEFASPPCRYDVLDLYIPPATAAIGGGCTYGSWWVILYDSDDTDYYLWWTYTAGVYDPPVSCQFDALEFPVSAYDHPLPYSDICVDYKYFPGSPTMTCVATAL